MKKLIVNKDIEKLRLKKGDILESEDDYLYSYNIEESEENEYSKITITRSGEFTKSALDMYIKNNDILYINNEGIVYYREFSIDDLENIINEFNKTNK